MPNYQPEITGAQIEAEESLLGAIMIQAQGGDNRTKELKIEPGDFYGCVQSDKPDRWPIRARVYYAMTQCDCPPHQINVANQMFNLGILHDGDCAMLCSYVAVTPCSMDYQDYAKVLKDYSVKRKAKWMAESGNIKGLNNLLKDKPLGTVPL
jgi:hypothetical protein